MPFRAILKAPTLVGDSYFVYPEGGKAEERITPPEPDGSEGATYMIRGKMMSVFSRKSLREHVPVRFTGILYYIPTKK